MTSIQNIITDSKRSKQTDHPKTTLTLDSDKQKQTLRKTRKRRTKCYHKHTVGCKTKLQNSKTLTKQNSKTQTQQGPQKLSKNTKNRDRHKIHKTRQVLTRPNKTSDINSKLHVSTYIKNITEKLTNTQKKNIQEKHTVQI